MDTATIAALVSGFAGILVGLKTYRQNRRRRPEPLRSPGDLRNYDRRTGERRLYSSATYDRRTYDQRRPAQRLADR